MTRYEKKRISPFCTSYFFFLETDKIFMNSSLFIKTKLFLTSVSGSTHFYLYTFGDLIDFFHREAYEVVMIFFLCIRISYSFAFQAQISENFTFLYIFFYFLFVLINWCNYFLIKIQKTRFSFHIYDRTHLDKIRDFQS